MVHKDYEDLTEGEMDAVDEIVLRPDDDHIVLGNGTSLLVWHDADHTVCLVQDGSDPWVFFDQTYSAFEVAKWLKAI